MDVAKPTLDFRKCKKCGEEQPLLTRFKKLIRILASGAEEIYYSHECHKCKYKRKKAWEEKPENSVKLKAQRRVYNASYLGIQRKARKRTTEGRAYAAAWARAWRAANPGKQKAAAARYFVKHKDRLAIKRDENIVEVRRDARERAARWRKRHPEKPRLNARAQRAKRRKARVETVTQKQIDDLFQKQRGRCPACRKKLDKYHVDHIQPISKGGVHAIHNLALLCPPCNMAKHNSDPIDFMQKLGFLL